MKLSKIHLLALLLLYLTITNTYGQHRKLGKIQRIIDKATNDNLVGVAVYVKSPEFGELTLVSGYSSLEEKIKLKKQNIFGLASIGKTYTAAAVFKLIEDGKLNLEDKISLYLPQEIIENVQYAEEVTIRHLLGHTSGFYNYNTDPKLNGLYLSGQLKLDTVSHLEILQEYFYGKPATNKPNERFKYSSTNYLLLTMIVDKVLGESHVNYFRSILAQYGFKNTWYKETPPQLIQHYGDLNQDGVSENLTTQVVETTNWYSGDDGFYASISEAGAFMEMLMKGEILNQNSLEAMMTWDNEKNPDYGLGIEIDKGFPYGLIMGHSGSGIGMRNDLYYSPKHDLLVGIFCNSGLRSASRSFAKTYYKMQKNIILKLFLF